jgi:hypothetical protein
MEKTQKRIFMTIAIGLIVLIALFIITGAITKFTGFSIFPEEDTAFEDCLKEKDITLYINSEDSSETLRKNRLIDYLDSVKIFNCARDNSICVTKGISSFPTWIINEDKIQRDISVSDLAQSSGCNLFKNG